MPNPIPPSRLSFEENISTLLEELLLAAKWQRPSILLAVHKSKFGQDKAEAALEDRLKKLGHNVVHITVDQDRSDIPHLIANTPAAEHSIFFISNLDWGGGEDHRDAYRSLNIYRETFVDQHLKVVLWLTLHEASVMARYAPDFWAFRHRVVEFTGQRIPHKISLSSGVLLWDIQNSVDPFDTPQARIAVREELLARLPNNMEARSSRLDLLYQLGYLYWTLGNTDKAVWEFQTALGLAEQTPAEKINASVLNGLAILSYEAKDCTRAASLLQKALQISPDDPYLLINQSVISSALGRNQEAVTLAHKALKINKRDPRLWAARGYVYAAMGKFDESITCMAKAVELAPRVALYQAALAICYDFVERPDETVRHLDTARALARAPMPVFLDIYEPALLGHASKSLELAQAAIRQDQVSAHELRRDPNLSLLLDSAQVDQLTA